jgi:hypothetical protein
MGTFVQATLQLPVVPDRMSTVQASLSLHEPGQSPSQVSGGSVTPLPHIGLQLGSVSALQLLGQHPSSAPHAVIGGNVHMTLQLAELPDSRSVVHTSASLQLAGQFPSQSSGGSTMALPHDALQLGSFSGLRRS